jgi:hypothetical protein
MVFFRPATDLKKLIKDIATHDPRELGDDGVKVLECVVLLGTDDLVCRVHADPRPGKGGAERIADWVISVRNAPHMKDHITDSHTYVVGLEEHGS